MVQFYDYFCSEWLAKHKLKLQCSQCERFVCTSLLANWHIKYWKQNSCMRAPNAKDCVFNWNLNTERCLIKWRLSKYNTNRERKLCHDNLSSLILLSLSLSLLSFHPHLFACSCVQITAVVNVIYYCFILAAYCSMHTNISRCFFINLLSNAIPFAPFFAQTVRTLTIIETC